MVYLGVYYLYICIEVYEKRTYLCIRRRRLTTMWAGINRERRRIIKINDVTEYDDNRKID